MHGDMIRRVLILTLQCTTSLCSDATRLWSISFCIALVASPRFSHPRSVPARTGSRRPSPSIPGRRHGSLSMRPCRWPWIHRAACVRTVNHEQGIGEHASVTKSEPSGLPLAEKPRPGFPSAMPSSRRGWGESRPCILDIVRASRGMFRVPLGGTPTRPKAMRNMPSAALRRYVRGRSRAWPWANAADHLDLARGVGA